MCKIIAFTDVKKLGLKKHVNNIGNILLASEPDGFGYAVKGKQGVFGEKTVTKQFRSRLNMREAIKLPVVKRQHECFGMPSELNGPGLFHGRTSTNVKGLKNTHPMQRPDESGFWHLIHNGVVTDHGPQYSKLTDNDSEDLLHRLMHGISEVEAHLTGYYAFAAIDPFGQLHIARDVHATLFMAWSEVYESYIIATTLDLIVKLNKMLSAKIGPIDEIEDNIYMIFKGNELIHRQDIRPRGFSHVESRHANASLGRRLGGGEVIIPASIESSSEPISESGWQSEGQWPEAIAQIEAGFKAGKEYSQELEDAYYALKHELDNMDASYTITDENGTFLKIHEFRKLDHISQECCTIIRGDGTVVDMSGDEHLKRA